MAFMELNQTDAPREDGRPDDLVRFLGEAAAYLHDIWPDLPRHAVRLEELKDRLLSQRLRVAVLGQFKRGKSTFLNALLGCPLLPTGVIPLTAIPTFLHWAPQYALQAYDLEGKVIRTAEAVEPTEITSILDRLVTEEGNPRNHQRVGRVDVFAPAPVLANGVELIDTPGIGSTHQHNTDAALAVLPECDAAFFVLSVDPPVTAAELEYLDYVRPMVAPILFILNKVDYFAAADRPAAAAFLRRTLSDHLPDETDFPIFSLAARSALEAKRSGDEVALANSGLIEVEHGLSQTLATQKREILRLAITRKAAAILDSARSHAQLLIRALEMPMDDLARRADQFAEAVRSIEQQRLQARDLLAGSRRRMLEGLEARAAMLREDARSSLIPLVDRAFSEGRTGAEAERAAKRAIGAAIPDFFEGAMECIAETAAKDLDAILVEHVHRATRVIDSVRITAAELFEVPAAPEAAVEMFVSARKPYWVTQKWDETLNPFRRGFLDTLMPRSIYRMRAKRRLAAEIDNLARRNVENLRWATLQNIEDAFRRFHAWFDEALSEAIEATKGAIEAARRKRCEHADQAEEDLSRLRSASDWIAASQRALAA